MKKIIYIEDSLYQLIELSSKLDNYVVYPEKDNHAHFILNVQNFLDPIGETITEKEISINEAKRELDLILGTNNIFILDYFLETNNSNSVVTGYHFYKKYLLKNTNIKNLKVLFMSSSEFVIEKLKEDVSLQNSNISILIKKNSLIQLEKIKEWIKA